MLGQRAKRNGQAWGAFWVDVGTALRGPSTKQLCDGTAASTLGPAPPPPRRHCPLTEGLRAHSRPSHPSTERLLRNSTGSKTPVQ